ncbi:DUF309 domain-containing protein [Tumidithrix elongata RA019]|uniref:DUF309 domain-containing protein n=1 Tax=Tumidithrix elongata BACA0141 TaxID=2716417 RepID=A0AAW9PVB7_9CYAN|nr:DUF309 domain-containing protein [Tumidithrix elongata RA019]
MTEDIAIAFEQAVEQFNQRDFYACHDTLEAIWMDALHPDKAFYQGLLQVAVGLYHFENHNWRGATILLGEGIGRLRYYLPTYGTVEVQQILTESAMLLATLQQAGAEGIGDLLRKFESGELNFPKILRCHED